MSSTAHNIEIYCNYTGHFYGSGRKRTLPSVGEYLRDDDGQIWRIAEIQQRCDEFDNPISELYVDMVEFEEDW